MSDVIGQARRAAFSTLEDKIVAAEMRFSFGN